MPSELDFQDCAVAIVDWFADAYERPTKNQTHTEFTIQCSRYGIWFPFDDFELLRYITRVYDVLMWKATFTQRTSIIEEVKVILKEMDTAERGIDPPPDDPDEQAGWIERKLEWVVAQIASLLTPIYNEIIASFQSIGGTFDNWFNPTTGIVTTFISDAIGGITGMFDLETGFIGRKIAGTLDAVIGLGSDIGDVIDSVLNIPSYLRAAANSFLKTILDNLELIFDAIVAGVRSALGAAYNWVVTQLKKVIAYVVEGFMSIISKARAGLNFLIITATTFINGRLDSVFNWLSTTYDRFKNAAIELLEEIYASMLAVFKLAVDELVAIPAELNLDIFNLIGGFTDIFDEFKRWLEEFLSIDTDTISGLVTQLIPLVDKPQQVAKT